MTGGDFSKNPSHPISEPVSEPISEPISEEKSGPEIQAKIDDRKGTA